MENLALASSPRLLLGYNSPQNPRDALFRQIHSSGFPLLRRRSRSCPSKPRRSSAVSASGRTNPPRKSPNFEKLVDQFASISSSEGTSSVAGNPPVAFPSQPSHVGSPLFWIGVGVGLSALFSFVVSNLKKYAMQQAFKSVMGQMSSQNNQFNSGAFTSESPFPFAASAGSSSTTSAFTAASKSVVTVDVPPTKVEVKPDTDGNDDKMQESEKLDEPKKYAFVDVSPDESSLRGSFESSETSSSKSAQFSQDGSPNGAAFKRSFSGSEDSGSTGKKGSVLSVEALEKMMEDPTVQQMVYPYLPEEMRNPATFKWMLQNPQYRKQLEEMLNNMGGSGEWDNRVADTLKSFDLSSPEVKQQFDQIGLTPEQVISKIMANPEVALAFQNPRVQAAIMDCSQNPLSISKYQNDKEVMDVFNKISELFPGVTGNP